MASCWLACRLCSSQVKFTKEAVAGHMRLAHGVTLATYEALYMQEEDWPVEGSMHQDQSTMHQEESSMHQEESSMHQEESTMHQEEITMHQEGRRRPSSHSFSSESVPGELVIAELEGEEQTRGGEGTWNRCCFQ